MAKKVRHKNSKRGRDLALCHVKVTIPEPLDRVLESLHERAKIALQRMIADKSYLPPNSLIPGIVADFLIEKYQNNQDLMTGITRLTNWGITIRNDDGRQIRLVDGGIRVPAVFKKDILPVIFPRKVVGKVIRMEFFKRRSKEDKNKRAMCAEIYYNAMSKREWNSDIARALQLKGAASIKGTPAATERALKGVTAFWKNKPATVAPFDLSNNIGLLNILADREKDILISRYGLNGEKVKTLAEIGKELGFTRERIRQLQNGALAKIDAHLSQVKSMAV